jgi:hypothetical protein
MIELFNILTQALIFLCFPFFISFLWGGNKCSSFLSTIIIAVTSLLNFNILSMALFINYIILDLVFRSENIQNYMIWHHIVSGSLTFLGLYITLEFSSNYSLIAIASHLLQMEITTPFLHFAKYCEDQQLKFESLFVLFCLILVWIPFRIVGPLKSAFIIKSIIELKETDLFLKNCLKIVFVLIVILFAFQIVWFGKLCVVMQKKFLEYEYNQKIKKLNNGKEK